MELKQLARILLSTDSSPTLQALKDKIEAYTRGQLPHAKDILPSLYELMDSDEAFKETPTQPLAPPNKAITGGDREGLKDALTWSLTSGTFLDSQFYALDSKSLSGAPEVRPVYFCSIVGGTFLPKLIKCKFFAPGLWNVIDTLARFVENRAIYEGSCSVYG